MSTIKKAKLAIYYGWPSGVNGAFSVAGAIAVFKAYELLVLGSGLEEPSHGDHVNTVQIIAGLPKVQVFGYVASTSDLALLKEKIDKWVTMGVSGIFCDVFGYDFGLTRQKQNEIVDYIHLKGLSAFVNVWNPDDAFSPSGPETTHLGLGDWVLAESYQIINDNYQSTEDWLARSRKLVGYRKATGTKIAAVTTTDSGIFDVDKFDYAYFSSLLFNFDAFGWGEKNFSALSGELPFHKRKHFYGTQFTGPITDSDGILSAPTNVGISVNTVTRTVDYVLP